MHDYSHGIPLDKLMPSGGYDKSGEIDVHAEWLAALNSAEGEQIILPSKTRLRLVTVEPFFVPAGGISIVCPTGDHEWHYVENSIGAHYDPETGEEDGIPGPNGYSDLILPTGGGDLTLKGFVIRGSDVEAQTSYNGATRIINGAPGVSTTANGRVLLDGMTFVEARSVPVWSENPLSFEMRGCTIARPLRGGVHVRGAYEYVTIEGNKFFRTRDDALSVRGARSTNKIDLTPYAQPQVRVCGNYFVESGGVRFNAINSAYASGNLHWLTSNHAYVVDKLNNNGPRPLSIIIEGNTIVDMLSPPDPYSHGSTFAAFKVFGTNAEKASLPVVPGQIDPATGQRLSPYPYEQTIPGDGPRLPLKGLVIRNNVQRRSIPTGVPYSTLGQGPAFEGIEARQDGHPTGFVDYTIPEEAARPDGLYLTGSVEGLRVEGNSFESLRHGIIVTWPGSVGFQNGVMNVDFVNNRWQDMAGDFFNAADSTSNNQRVNIRMVGETVNLDPHFIHAQRLPNGKWSASNSSGNLFNTGNIGTSSIREISFENGEVSNLARLFSTIGAYNNGNFILRNTTLIADPVALGDDADNKGIRHVLAPSDAVNIRVVEADPTSASYGLMKTQPFFTRSPRPITGFTQANNDGSITWTFGTVGPSIEDTSTLTNNRWRNLSLTGAQTIGSVFEIARTGADTDGPWALRVRNDAGTTLAELATGQWGRFVWTGTEWRLLSRGGLT